MKFNRLAWLWSMVVLCTFACSFRVPLVEVRSSTCDMFNGKAKTTRKSDTEDLNAPTLTAGRVTASTGDPVNTSSLPVLSSPSVWPANGTPITSFTFWITYTDASNLAPTWVYLNVNNTIYSMYKWYYNDYNYTDGCLYYDSVSLSSGNHKYWFEASNAYYTDNTSVFSGPCVKIPTANPILLNATVTPTTGTSSTLFTFRVVYYHADNVAPSYVEVIVTRSSGSTVLSWYLIQENSTDTNYVDGCAYYLTDNLLASSDNYSYYFKASDGYHTIFTASNAGLSVTYSLARLSLFSFSPSSGDTNTEFTFTVKYIDPSNEAPHDIELEVMISQNAGYLYSMDEEQPASADFKAGCYYTCSAKLPSGSYEVYVYCYDASGNEVISSSATIHVSQTSGSTSEFSLTDGSWQVIGVYIIFTLFFVIIIIGVRIHIRKSKNAGMFGSTTSQRMPVNLASGHRLNYSSNQVASYISSHVASHSTTPVIQPNPVSIPQPRSGPLPLVVNPRIPRSAFINRVQQTSLITPDQSDNFVMPRIDDTNLNSFDAWDDEAWVTPAPVNILLYDDANDDIYAIIPNNNHMLAPKVSHAYVDANCLNMISPNDVNAAYQQPLAKLMLLRDPMPGHLAKLDLTKIACMAMLNNMKEKELFTPTGRMRKDRLAYLAADKQGCLPGIDFDGMISLMQHTGIIVSVTAKTIMFAPWLLVQSTLNAFNAAVLSVFKKFYMIRSSLSSQ